MKTIIIDLANPINRIEITEDSYLVGLFIGRADTTIKTHLEVVHKRPDLKSKTAIKAVLYDKSKFDFTGDLIIEKGAKNTDTYLKVDVLMMSEDVSARAVPSLEIMEDQVKGGHGATVGEVDEEQLFYLMTRGLSPADAEQILVDGFIGDIQATITKSLTENLH